MLNTALLNWSQCLYITNTLEACSWGSFVMLMLKLLLLWCYEVSCDVVYLRWQLMFSRVSFTASLAGTTAVSSILWLLTTQEHTLLLKTEEVSISTVTEKLTWWSAFMCSFINDQPEKNKNIIQDDNDNNKEIFRFIHAGELGTNCYPSENHSVQTHIMINVMLCNLLPGFTDKV